MAMPFQPLGSALVFSKLTCRSGELHKHGIKIKLHDQPFQVWPCCWNTQASW